MKNFNKFLTSLFFTGFFLIVLSSYDVVNSTSDNVISGKGTIHKIDNDFIINTDNSLVYEIINPSDEFKVDNLEVEFKGIVHENPNPN
jgi:hypothetical protein